MAEGEVYVILKDYHSEGLRPFAAYADMDEAVSALALVQATGLETFVMYYATESEPLLTKWIDSGMA